MGNEIRDKVKSYQFYSDELESTYPTDCPRGSMMEILDRTTHDVVGYKQFDGVGWGKL